MAWDPTIEGMSFLYILNCVATLLSLIGSSWMSYYCFKSLKFRNVSIQLILAIAISDFLFSIANIMSSFEGQSMTLFCQIEAYLRQSSFFSSIFFSTCTAVFCYQTLNHAEKFNQTSFFKKSLIFGAIILLSQLLISVFLFDAIVENSTTFCWLAPPRFASGSKKLTIFMIYEGLPLIFGLLISFIGYLCAILKVRQMTAMMRSSLGFNVYKLLWYPAILFIVFFPSLIDNFAAVNGNYRNPVFVKAIHLFLTHSIGVWNAIVYGLQRKWRHTVSDNSNVVELLGSEGDSMISAESQILQKTYFT